MNVVWALRVYFVIHLYKIYLLKSTQRTNHTLKAVVVHHLNI